MLPLHILKIRNIRVMSVLAVGIGIIIFTM